MNALLDAGRMPALPALSPIYNAAASFGLWLGFVATTQLATVLFEQRRFGLYLLNVSYQLVACLSCAAILSAWRKRGLAEPAKAS